MPHMRPGDWGQQIDPFGVERVGQVLNVEEWVKADGKPRRTYIVRWEDGTMTGVAADELVYRRAGVEPMVKVTMPRSVWMDVIGGVYVAQSEGQCSSECVREIIEALGMEYHSWMRPW